MSMFNDIDWTQKGHSDVCISNVREVIDNVKEFLLWSWRFFLHWTYARKPEGKWDQQDNHMIEQFQPSGHTVFRGTNALG